jgi:alkylated DNA nucleotide flippase Atl1
MSERYLEQQSRLAAEGIIIRKGKIPLPEAQWQL